MMKHPVYNAFLVGTLWMAVICSADAATVAGEVNKANAFYDKAKFDEALEHYQKALDKDPQSAPVQYNLGTAFYKKGNYADALDHLQKALLADDPQLQQKTRYNLANTFYKHGIAKENSDLSAAIEDLKNALGYYEKNLTVLPKDSDAQNNHDFVQKELERLKEKKKQQEEQKQQTQQNKSEQPKQGDQQNNGQQGQDQNNDSKGQDKNEQPSTDQKKDQDNPGEKKDGQGQDDQKNGSKDQNDDPPDKNDQKKKGQSQSKPGDKGGDPQNENSGNAPNGEHGPMTPKEAQMLLDDYQRNDEPKGMLYFKPESNKSGRVEKDW